MYNPEMKGVHKTRDVTWLRRMFYEMPERVGEITNEGVELDIDEMEDNMVTETVAAPQVEAETPIAKPEKENVVADAANVTGPEIPTVVEGYEKTYGYSRAGRALKAPTRCDDKYGDAGLVTPQEREYYKDLLELSCIMYLMEITELVELGCVGAGLSGGFENTHELHVMNYDQGMATADEPGWKKSVFTEHLCFKDNGSP